VKLCDIYFSKKVNVFGAIIFFLISGLGLLGTAATTGLLYQSRVIGHGNCGEIGGMKIGRGTYLLTYVRS
jgi:hypothetical protein